MPPSHGAPVTDCHFIRHEAEGLPAVLLRRPAIRGSEPDCGESTAFVRG